MSSSPSRIPLYLFQVLEDEYAALHGQELADVKWDFKSDHIIDASTLIGDLQLSKPEQRTESTTDQDKSKESKTTASSTAASEDPDSVAKAALLKYLRSNLAGKKFESTGAQLVADALNSFLTDENLFDETRFSNHTLNYATRGMRDIHTSRLPNVLGLSSRPLTGDDLEHFNRLLLEDAFPCSLKKIHRLRLDRIYGALHEKKQTALCLSGGGIRSGTFALGLLQGLARHDLLDKFHFLSTVSGGGYIGSWLAAWIHRHPLGLRGVTSDLANTVPPTKVDPDPQPIRYLRKYSSFITPKVGLLSADTWTFVAIYLRNLLLNWIVFIPLLLALVALPRLIVSLTRASTNPTMLQFSVFGRVFDLYWRHLFLALGFVLLVWALAYIIFNRPSLREELRQNSPFWRRMSSQKWFLFLCLLPLTISAFCLTTYWAWSSQPQRLLKLSVFALASTVLAWLISCWVLHHFRLSRDLLYLLVAGAGGGLLLYWLMPDFGSFQAETWNGFVFEPWQWKTELYACLATPAFLLVFLLGATLYIGASSKVATSVNDDDREWWARLGAWVLIVILAWIAFTTIVILGPVALLSAPKSLSSIGGLSGVLAALIAKSAKTSGNRNASKQDASTGAGIVDAILSKALPLLAAIFIVFLLALLSLALTGTIQIVANQLPGLSKAFLMESSKYDAYLKFIYLDVAGKDYWEQSKIAHMNVVHMTSFRMVLIIGLFFFIVGGLASLLMNLNVFSLHGGYRNRLIRAFLGASRPNHQRKPNPFTDFDPADNVSMHELRPGFFTEDDFPHPVALANVLLNRTDVSRFPGKRPHAAEVAAYLAKRDLLVNLEAVGDTSTYSIRLVAALRTDLNAALRDGTLRAWFSTKCPNLAPTQSECAKTSDEIFANREVLVCAFKKDWIKPATLLDKDYRLMPVINTTLNLVGGDNLAWQQRKAEPFSVTPLHSGCFRLGYRDSRFYGGRDTGGISIGTAAAISGAAASSNMGYYTTSPVLSLVLTFFNVRLGWWLGNPGLAGNDTYDQRAPRSSVKPVLDEALGLTDDENKYIYLTDGGHFENLAIYEMVLRRCHRIIVSDATGDPGYSFSDLGNAIRKIRIDLGVPIEFTAVRIFPAEPGDKRKGMYWAMAKIRYSCIDGKVDDGLLLYIKPSVYGTEPGDVLEYKKSHSVFPHQSTADQFFDEPQFESYRILGSYIMDQLCGSGNESLNVDEVFEKAVEKLIDASHGGAADPDLEKWIKDFSLTPKTIPAYRGDPWLT